MDEYSNLDRFLKKPHPYELILLNPLLRKKNQDEINDLIRGNCLNMLNYSHFSKYKPSLNSSITKETAQ